MDPFFLRFFPNDGSSMQGYHQELQDCMPRQGVVLDLGCGDHRQLACYRTPERQIWGTDVAVHPCLQDGDWFRLMDTSGGIPFPADSFDLVASTWVLEHVASPTGFLQESYRVLRPGGRLVALTTNGLHYLTAASRWWRLLPGALARRLVRLRTSQSPQSLRAPYLRLNTGPQIRRAAWTSGLQLANLRYYANPEQFTSIPPLHRMAVLTDWLLSRLREDLGRRYLVATLEKPKIHSVSSIRRKAAA